VAGVYLIFRNRLFRDAVGAILTTHPEIKLLEGCQDWLPIFYWTVAVRLMWRCI
jgi:hypothetical protein